MKKSILLNIFLCLLCAGVIPVHGETNILLNPGFELDDFGDVVPMHWGQSGQDRVKGTDLGVTPHAGSKQYQLQANNSMIYQAVTLASGTYHMSMWVASRNSSSYFLDNGKVHFELVAGDHTGVPLSPDVSSSPDITAPKGVYYQWTRTFNRVSAGTYTLRVRLNPDGQGMVDEFSLVKLPPKGTVITLF